MHFFLYSSAKPPSSFESLLWVFSALYTFMHASLSSARTLITKDLPDYGSRFINSWTCSILFFTSSWDIFYFSYSFKVTFLNSSILDLLELVEISILSTHWLENFERDLGVLGYFEWLFARVVAIFKAPSKFNLWVVKKSKHLTFTSALSGLANAT